MKCRICHREAQKNDLCCLHLRAYENIKDKFVIWQKASNVKWVDYLYQLQKNSLTGVWAKEVAKYLIGEEEKDVRENKENV